MSQEELALHKPGHTLFNDITFSWILFLIASGQTPYSIIVECPIPFCVPQHTSAVVKLIKEH